MKYERCDRCGLEILEGEKHTTRKNGAIYHDNYEAFWNDEPYCISRLKARVEELELREKKLVGSVDEMASIAKYLNMEIASKDKEIESLKRRLGELERCEKIITDYDAETEQSTCDRPVDLSRTGLLATIRSLRAEIAEAQANEESEVRSHNKTISRLVAAHDLLRECLHELVDAMADTDPADCDHASMLELCDRITAHPDGKELTPEPCGECGTIHAPGQNTLCSRGHPDEGEPKRCSCGSRLFHPNSMPLACLECGKRHEDHPDEGEPHPRCAECGAALPHPGAVCPRCYAQGEPQQEPCRECGGWGYVIDVTRDHDAGRPYKKPCPSCGTGEKGE